MASLQDFIFPLIYLNKQRYNEIVEFHMENNDSAQVIGACKKYGYASSITIRRRFFILVLNSSLLSLYVLCVNIGQGTPACGFRRWLILLDALMTAMLRSRKCLQVWYPLHAVAVVDESHANAIMQT